MQTSTPHPWLHKMHTVLSSRSAVNPLPRFKTEVETEDALFDAVMYQTKDPHRLFLRRALKLGLQGQNKTKLRCIAPASLVNLFSRVGVSWINLLRDINTNESNVLYLHGSLLKKTETELRLEFANDAFMQRYMDVLFKSYPAKDLEYLAAAFE
jgi:hypothetical protein